jgi:tripartite-type tricarboxylate transporter receptor subunit TctC
MTISMTSSTGLLSVLCISAALHGAALAQQAHYEMISKPITLYAAGTSGGGVDTFARLLSRHIGRHINGAPNVIVQDMPGAGGIRAANFMVESALRDGTALATFAGGPILEPLIGARNPGYDMSQFSWIGAMSRDVSLCVTWHQSGIARLSDARQREVVVAGTGAGSETDTLPVIMNEVLGTKFKVVTGYLGTQQTIMAIESGEVQGRCGYSLSSLKSTKPDWLADHKLNIILQMGLSQSEQLPDTPFVFDEIKSQEDKDLLMLLLGPTGMSRAFAGPPHMEASKRDILRQAFDATMHDAAFLHEAQVLQAEIDPSDGAAVQHLVSAIYSTPKAVIERAKKYITSP